MSMQYFNENQYLNIVNYSYNGTPTEDYRSLEYATKVDTSYGSSAPYQYAQTPPSRQIRCPVSVQDAVNYGTSSSGGLMESVAAPKAPMRDIRVKKIKVPVQPMFCNVCQVTLNSPSQADAHFRGQQHRKAVNKDNSNTTKEKCDTQPENLMAGATADVDAGQKNDVSTSAGMMQNPGEVTMFASPAEEGGSNDALPEEEEEGEGGQEPQQKKRKVVLSLPCEICCLTFNSERQASAHFMGSKHLKKIKSLQRSHSEIKSQFPGVVVAPDPTRKWRFHCNICNIMSNSSLQFDQHCSGVHHMKKMHEYSDPKNEVPGQKSGWFHCRLCNVSCRTAMGLQTHVTSEPHKERAVSRRDLIKVNSILSSNGH